jgi:hypothetical protein
VFFGLLSGILCISDHSLTTIVSSRAALVLVLLFCARWERSMWLRDELMGETCRLAKASFESAMTLSDFHALLCEIKCLSQTVVQLSDQHALLREIKTGVHKAARCSKEVLSKIEETERVEKARRKLRRGSLSDSCITGSGAFSDLNGDQ